MSERASREVLAYAPGESSQRAWSIPASWYLSEEIAELERELVFGRAWALAARAEEVAESGSYVSGIAGDLPWVLTRAEDGEVRALANVCRHKASLVCDGAGRAERLVCPYHGWAYRLDGTLASAPRTAGILGGKGVPRRLGLPALGLSRWGALYFVHRDVHARPLGELVPAAPSGRIWRDAERLVWWGSKRWELACNWKVFVDNYLDGGYHVPHVHPGLDAQLAMGTYRTEIGPGWSLQSAGAAEDDEAARARIGEGADYLWLWPNVMINRYGPVLDINVVQPLGPRRCRVDFEFWFDRERLDDPEAFIADSVARSVATQEEDQAICERVQVGIASRTWTQGPLAPGVEAAIRSFHRQLATTLQGGVARRRVESA